MTLVVPELVNTDFTEDIEKMIMNYVFQEWSISDPAKGSDLIDDSDPSFVRFRIGLPDFTHAYEITFLQTVTAIEPMGIGKDRFLYTTVVEALIRMRRLPKPFGQTGDVGVGIDPQLGNMERELQRIFRHYPPNAITGIKDIYSNGPNAQQRIYKANDNWMKSDWRSVIRCSVWYEKENLH